MVGNQLQTVFISGDDIGKDTVFFGVVCHGPQNVISFVPFFHQAVNSQKGGYLPHIGDLHLQFFGHGFSGGFIVGIGKVPESGGFQIEGNGGILRLNSVQMFFQNIEVTENGVGIQPFFIC